jgi:hypothetical protein
MQSFKKDEETIAQFYKDRDAMHITHAEKGRELDEKYETIDIVISTCIRITEIRTIFHKLTHDKILHCAYDMNTILLHTVNMHWTDCRRLGYEDQINDARKELKALDTVLKFTPTVRGEHAQEYKILMTRIDTPWYKSVINELVATLTGINKSLPRNKKLTIGNTPETHITQNARSLYLKFEEKI